MDPLYLFSIDLEDVRFAMPDGGRYRERVPEMTRRFPKLYGDNSAFNVPMRGRHTPKCLLEPLASRILHGSDFPVPVHGHWSWLRGFIKWREFRQWENNPNILERDYQLKRAMGFPPETFTRIWSLLRQPLKPISAPRTPFGNRA